MNSTYINFGLWQFLGPSRKNKHRQTELFCKCKCGVKRYVIRYNLEKGHSKGCESCSRKKRSLVGNRFGRLTVERYLKNKKSECLCDCGNFIIVNDSNLLKGNTTSCGCKSSIDRITYDLEMKNKLSSSVKEVNGCWEWSRSRNKKGYGHFCYKRKVYLAHRISWKLYKGEIQKNLKICHKCDNPSCVNPDHLFIGSQKENMQDMFKKRRKNHQGEKHPKAKLTKEIVLEIRSLIEKGITQEIICKKYGITNAHVGSIKHRRTWAHI